MDSTFEAELKSHETLYNLIEKKEIGTFVKFPSKSEFSAEFLDWLSPKYFDAFQYIFNTYLNTKKEAKIVKLINSPWFCNEDTSNKILKLFEKRLTFSAELSEKLKRKIIGNRDLEAILQVSATLTNDVLNFINKALFEKDFLFVKEQKNIIINNALSVCEELKQYKASSEVEFAMFNGLLDRIKSISLNEDQQERYDRCVKKSKSSSNKYVAVSVIIGIIAIIRLIAKLSS